MERFRNALIGIAALLVLTAIGTAGYVRLEGFDLGEALFMTVTVLSTVGLQPRPLGPGGRALTVALIVLGLGVVLYTVALITQQLIEGEFLFRNTLGEPIEQRSFYRLFRDAVRVFEIRPRDLYATKDT